MRVFFISYNRGCAWGGAEELWSRTALEALANGHDVGFSTYEWPETPKPVVNLIEQGALWFPRSVSDSPTLVTRAWHRIRPRSRKRNGLKKGESAIIKAIQVFEPEVIFVNEGGTFNRRMVNFLESIRETGIPYFMICQNGQEDGIALDEYMRKAFKSIFNDAHLVGFPARRNIRNAERLLACTLPKARVIQNPIPHPTSPILDWPSECPLRLVAPGRLHADKGHDLLLDALSSAKWQNRDWRLSIYGEGVNLPWLQDLTAFLGLKEKVDFPGHVSDVTQIWRNSHLTILSSRTEGAPLMMIQSLVCGRPVLVTDVGGNCEWVSEPEVGFVAAATTVSSIDEALDRAWKERKQLRSVGIVARKKTMAKLDKTPPKTMLAKLCDAAKSRISENSFSVEAQSRFGT